MSTTHLINQAVLEQRHASESQLSQQRRGMGSKAKRVKNVGAGEQQISLLSGAILAGLGLARGGMSGLLIAGLGGALAYRGVTGHCSLYEAMGVNTSDAT